MSNSKNTRAFEGDPLRELDSSKEFAEVRLTSMGSLGDTVAEFEDATIQIFGGIVGELVKARIYRYKRRRKGMISGMVSEVIEPSPHRVESPCSYFGFCSGCQWQHISYEHQLTLKRDMVRNAFDDYPSLSEVFISGTHSAPTSFNYRNHARFTVRFGGQLGFSNRITRRFVRIDECMLMDPKINDFLSRLQDEASETTNLSIRVGANSGDYLIQPELSNPNIDFDTGQKWYVENMLDRQFRVASPSFFQVNTKQAEFMINLVGEKLNLDGNEVLVDAYAGVGVFASLLSRQVTKVIAIEESASAIKDAAINTLGIDNLEFREGKTEAVLDSIEYTPEAVILDPPRAGCHIKALNALKNLGAKRVCYVSCDPVTLARDLAILCEGNYKIQNVQPIDMFPQTYHTECIVTMQIKDSNI